MNNALAVLDVPYITSRMGREFGKEILFSGKDGFLPTMALSTCYIMIKKITHFKRDFRGVASMTPIFVNHAALSPENWLLGGFLPCLS
jgi:hypothetical protein